MAKYDFIKEMMLSVGDEEGKGTVFNMAFGLLNHLNFLIGITSMSRINQEYSIWFQSLASLYSIVAAYLSPEDYDSIDVMFKETWTACENYESIQNMKNAEASGDITETFKNKLHNFDLELKRLMKKEGLLIPVKKGIGSALEQ